MIHWRYEQAFKKSTKSTEWFDCNRGNSKTNRPIDFLALIILALFRIGIPNLVCEHGQNAIKSYSLIFIVYYLIIITGEPFKTFFEFVFLVFELIARYTLLKITHLPPPNDAIIFQFHGPLWHYVYGGPVSVRFFCKQTS